MSAPLRRPRILVVEDEQDIGELLEYNLRKQNYEVARAADGSTALRLAFSGEFSAVVLDLMLPDMDGLDICRQLREEKKTRRWPVLMLTARAEVNDRVTGLNLGADDYLGKPFEMAELLARLKALLRRTQAAADPEPVATGNLRIDESRRLVEVAGQRVELTQKEFALLLLFVRERGRVLTRNDILDEVWGRDYYGDQRTIDVHIRRLRSKLDGMQPPLKTIRGVGYTLAE